MGVVTVITLFLLRCSWCALFFPLLLTVFFARHSATSRRIQSERYQLLQKPSLFSPPSSLWRYFFFFYLLCWINAAPTAHSEGWGVSVCWWEAAWPLGSRMSGCRQLATCQQRALKKINKLWFKLWYWKQINSQCVYLKSANKHHMLQRLFCTSKLSFSNYKIRKQTCMQCNWMLQCSVAMSCVLCRALFWNMNRELSSLHWVNPPGAALQAGFYLANVF